MLDSTPTSLKLFMVPLSLLYDAKKKEIVIDSESKDKEDNTKAEENEVSDSDSTTTVEFTASELNERTKDLEHEDEANEVIEIVTEDE